ncbi:hypothetical protein C1T31_10155 [Hanstruepera neustonica]|uniref:Type I restriction modification DNA specificity domain-containing protein n=1 Tax=Hanstruepera neustonica TaxID=1445657 RepID=A0A2K1DXV3_9FLAO|nr:restriction endonuclease subunit S [Hanstruepera neustonica]PNQ72858.1 hypothetical protein C1T31_10155 [Hanstruepera neustonica]
MKLKIRNICQISTGVYVKTERVGDVYYLQARDFNTYNELDPLLKPEVFSYNINEKHYLGKGDVIIAAKGSNHFAFTYNNEVQPAVASSMFIVLRQFDQNKVIPGFISWFINHPQTQTLLEHSHKGSGIPSISKSIIGDLEINLPSLKEQELILSIDRLKINEAQLNQEIAILKNQVLNEQLLRLIQK